MVAAALTSLSFMANTPRYIELTSLIAIVVAAILFFARVLRLGFLADFLSRSVLVGFLSGVGVQVAVGELRDMLGVRQLLYTFEHLRDTHLPSLLIALATLAIIVLFELVAPRFPGALLAVIGMTAASAYFHWADRGIQVVGAVPSGLPPLGLPHIAYSDIITVLPISLSCFIVISRKVPPLRAPTRLSTGTNSTRMWTSSALANAAAGCSSTFVVNGSPTKTAMVDTADGRSQWSHLTTATVVLTVLLFFTRPLSFLPNTVLAAIVFHIGIKLIDHRGLREIQRAQPNEFAIALVTAATVVIFGVEQGIILAVVLSLLQHVRRSYRPQTGVAVRDAADHWRIEDPMPVKLAEPGMVIFWFGTDLFYANVAFLCRTSAHARARITHASPLAHH